MRIRGVILNKAALSVVTTVVIASNEHFTYLNIRISSSSVTRVSSP